MLKAIGVLYLTGLWGAVGAALLYLVLLLVGADVLGRIGREPLQNLLLYGLLLVAASVGALSGLLGGGIGLSLRWRRKRILAAVSAFLLLAANAFALAALWPIVAADRRLPMVALVLVYTALAGLAVWIVIRPASPAPRQSR